MSAQIIDQAALRALASEFDRLAGWETRLSEQGKSAKNSALAKARSRTWGRAAEMLRELARGAPTTAA